MDSDLEEEMDVDDPDPIDDLDLIHAGNEQKEGDTGHAREIDNDDVEDGINQQENSDVDDVAASGEAEGEKKEIKEIKKKRVILNPQPKLNYHTLTGKRGLSAMKEIFADIKFKGKGHELSDLNIVMTRLEYWTHRLFPRYSFDGVLSGIEKLGSKKQVQVYIKRMRLGMDDLLNPISNEFIEQEPSSPPPQESTDNVFDSLLQSEPQSLSPKPRVEITAEQKERMERNRQLAIEKRLARIEAQKEEERRKLSENAGGRSGEENAEQLTASTSLPENPSEPEIVEININSRNKDENLFECSQEVSSILTLSGCTPEVLSVNVLGSTKSNVGNQGESVPEMFSHIDVPAFSPDETESRVGGDLGKPVDSSLSGFDKVPAPDDSTLITEGTIGETISLCSKKH